MGNVGRKVAWELLIDVNSENTGFISGDFRPVSTTRQVWNGFCPHDIANYLIQLPSIRHGNGDLFYCSFLYLRVCLLLIPPRFLLRTFILYSFLYHNILH
jgi:hypothetical protein